MIALVLILKEKAIIIHAYSKSKKKTLTDEENKNLKSLYDQIG